MYTNLHQQFIHIEKCWIAPQTKLTYCILFTEQLYVTLVNINSTHYLLQTRTMIWELFTEYMQHWHIVLDVNNTSISFIMSVLL